ncbi:MAG: hypothetical protein ACL93V_14240 [Candidatus Electrothrix sp. YB6]
MNSPAGRASSPYVSIINGTITEPEILRIQAVLDLRADTLIFSLINMHEEGTAGPAVAVTANGGYTLNGFADSAVSSLDIRVDSYTALKDMIRNDYSGRLVDILDVRLAG